MTLDHYFGRPLTFEVDPVEGQALRGYDLLDTDPRWVGGASSPEIISRDDQLLPLRNLVTMDNLPADPERIRDLLRANRPLLLGFFTHSGRGELTFRRDADGAYLNALPRQTAYRKAHLVLAVGFRGADLIVHDSREGAGEFILSREFWTTHGHTAFELVPCPAQLERPF